MSNQKDILNNPIVRRIKDHLRVTKVVCTRSVKGATGDNYVGFSAGWDSIQDDAGGSADLMQTQGDGDVRIATSQIGMTLKEAKVAALMLGLQADISAHEHSAASGSITQERRAAAVHAIMTNYYRLIGEALGVGKKETDEVKNG